MFNKLFQLALTTPLMMTISANSEAGTLTLNVIPTPKRGDKGGELDPALTQKLSLTATPEEFEQGFPQCLGSYTETYKSLQEQVDATKAVLDAAKSAQVQKAASAVTKSAPKPATNGGAQAASVESDPDDDGAEGEKKSDAKTESGSPSLFDD